MFLCGRRGRWDFLLSSDAIIQSNTLIFRIKGYIVLQRAFTNFCNDLDLLYDLNLNDKNNKAYMALIQNRV